MKRERSLSIFVARDEKKHRLSSCSNETLLPPLAYRFGSLLRLECEPSALSSTLSLLQVRLKRENDGSGVPMLSFSFFLSCFARHTQKFQKKPNSLSSLFKPAARRPWPLQEAVAAPGEEETAGSINSSSYIPRSRPPRRRESQQQQLLQLLPLNSSSENKRSSSNNTPTTRTPTTRSPRSRRSSLSSPRTPTTDPWSARCRRTCAPASSAREGIGPARRRPAPTSSPRRRTTTTTS